MGIEVHFRDFETNEIINSWYTDWKFEVGQRFNGFWGCDSTVMKVELMPEVEKDVLIMVQIVYVKRIPLKF